MRRWRTAYAVCIACFTGACAGAAVTMRWMSGGLQ